MKSFDDELVHKTVRELFDMLKSKQAEVDELRKRIDNALGFTEGVHSENWQEAIHCVNNILKGDSHES